MQSKAVTIFEVPMLNNVDSLACLHVVYRTCIGRQKKKKKEEGTGKKREREERKKKETQISHAEFTDERPSSYHSTVLI